MVAGDRIGDEPRNGRRSRGPSPNGHLSDDSSASDDSVQGGGMRVGSQYQAAPPQYNPDYKPDPRPEAILVWAPSPALPDEKVSEYTTVAKEKHGYNTEQALGMLFWHKHNVEKALADLPNFTPFPDEWSVEDKVLFEQAFSFHGKSFNRIRQMLPDKSKFQLVKYYYSWKKTRSRTSLMDRQAKKLNNHRDVSDDDESNSESDDTDVRDHKPKGVISRSGPGLIKKPDLHPRNKHKRKPPRGMYLQKDDLLSLATGPPGQGEALLKQLDSELVTLKRTVQNNKQLVCMHKQKTTCGINKYRPTEALQKINARWTQEELLLAVQGLRKYGKNFKAIGEVIGNKTESHMRSFFVNYRRRYNLDEVLAEYERENGTTIDLDDIEGGDEKMEVDGEKPDDESETTKNGPAVPPPPLVKGSSQAQNSPIAQVTGANKGVLQQPPPLIRQPVKNPTTNGTAQAV